MSLAEQIVLLANELIVVEHVQLLASAQLFPTNTARKAVQVEHLVARLSHEVRWRQSLSTAPAFRSVSPRDRDRWNRLMLVDRTHITWHALDGHYSPIEVVSAI